jgi:flagellar M-ring protein FliF
MAAAEESLNMLSGVSKSAMSTKLLLALGIAAVIAAMSVVWLWSQQPDYRVLFSNYSDKDGGAVVAALEQMNIPYKFSEGGSAILVPAEQVHTVRLKLASQGLPKGGNVGFELMENQKFGISQFVEQVNFQRALEGELERSVQSIAAVQMARIHLALPKASVFVRDQQKPTASVLLNLHPGRSLDPQQVSAIVHLVASSVPDLPAANVTIVDQNGNFLSDNSKPNSPNNLDPSQLKYVEEIQKNIAKRVESIISPILGANNVRAEASAEVDFSNSEQAAEIYKPNQSADASAIRSMQTSESKSTTESTAAGVPGALSNQPPAPATAPIVGNSPATPAGTAPASQPVNTQKNSTTNFEVDKTVRYVQQPMGGIKRLSVAVVVNYKQVVGKNGKITNQPLSEAEKAQISDLAKQAMGFSKERGDSLSVVNSAFAETPPEIIPEPPLWKQPENIALAKEMGKYLLAIAVMLMLYLRLLKPLLRKLTTSETAPALLTAQEQEDALVTLSANAEGQQQQFVPITQNYQMNLEMAKQLAKENPKMVANVVTAWVSNNE